MSVRLQVSVEYGVLASGSCRQVAQDRSWDFPTPTKPNGLARSHSHPVIPTLQLADTIRSSGQWSSPAGVGGTRQATLTPPQDTDLSASRGNDRFVCVY